MYKLTINIPEETALALALKLTPEELSQEMKLIAVIKLYQLGRLSSGTAANLAGIPKSYFPLPNFQQPSLKLAML